MKMLVETCIWNKSINLGFQSATKVPKIVDIVS